MKLFNSLSKKLEDFEPLNSSYVNVYSCGPTLYDLAHIGNLGSFIYADTLRRVLLLSGYKVKHVMNFTDVDDKTIKRSSEESPDSTPKEALEQMTKKFGDNFLNDMGSIGNNTQQITFVKATEHIEEMQSLVRDLLEAGFAYTAGDGVYFSISAYKNAGRKYGQLINLDGQNTSSARIDNDEYDKDNVNDFALWKKQKTGEPAWEFEIKGEKFDGRPGWHIECSAMSQAKFDLPFDIHTGGIDLIFPHHENEIAQSTANNNSLMARYFVHNNHLLVDSKKMSKSLGNFFTLRDIINRGFDPLALRLLILQSHYRSQSNFTWEALTSMQTKLDDIRAWSDLRFQNLNSESLKDKYSTLLYQIKSDLQNDLNTPSALAHLNGILSLAAEIGADSAAVDSTTEVIDSIFGLCLSERQDINSNQKSLLAQRQTAREQNNWNMSDSLREQLYSQDIIVRDTKQGQIWERLEQNKVVKT